MSTLSYPHAGRDASTTTYAQNVAIAFRSLLAALLAVKAQPPVSQRVKVRDQLAVFKLAREYETLSPNLAAELRYFASHG